MGWVDNLRGTVVGLDTAPLIAFIEEQPVNVEMLRPFFRSVQNYEISLVTSTVMNATYFLTNDLRLPSLPELKILTLDELKTRPEYLTPDDLH